jgi:hypothetical protein
VDIRTHARDFSGIAKKLPSQLGIPPHQIGTMNNELTVFPLFKGSTS